MRHIGIAMFVTTLFALACSDDTQGSDRVGQGGGIGGTPGGPDGAESGSGGQAGIRGAGDAGVPGGTETAGQGGATTPRAGGATIAPSGSTGGAGIDGGAADGPGLIKDASASVDVAPRPDGALGATASSFALSSTVGGAKLPFTVGLAFGRGDVPTDFALDLLNAQVEIKRRWNDGSVKHAVVSGHVDLVAGQPKTIKVVNGSTPQGKKLTCGDIQAAAPQSSVSLGAMGSVDLASLLAAPVRTWSSGSEVVECHYRGKVGTDASLRVQFQVRLYREGRIFIRAIAENGYLDVKTVDKTYAPLVTIDNKVVFDGGGQPLVHYAHTRWFAEAWLGGDPQVIPKHDVRALVESRLVPNYRQKPAAAAALAALYQSYKPMEHGDWTPTMGDAGYQDQIGLLPNWDALVITSNADARAVNASQANAKALNSYPIVWRDSADDQVTRPSARPTWTIEGKDGGGATSFGAGALSWDNAHHGSGGYLAYLITGDYLFLETMAMQASTVYVMMSSIRGAGQARILAGQTRAMAWTHRTVGQYAAVAPLEPVAEDYRGLLATNAAYWKAEVAKIADKHLGLVYEYDLGDGGYGGGLIAPWQHNFVVQVFGHLSDLEPLADMTSWNAVRDYAYQFPVGLLGEGGADGYCFTKASQYTVRVADGAVGNLGATYASWGTVYAKMFNTAACGNKLEGSPEAAATAYWGNLMPAVAYAVDHGATGAAAAWARMTGASNYSAIQNSPFETTAVWGVVPR